MKYEIEKFIQDNFTDQWGFILFKNNGKLLFDELCDFLRWELPDEESFNIELEPIDNNVSILMIAWVEKGEVQLFYKKVGGYF